MFGYDTLFVRFCNKRVYRKRREGNEEIFNQKNFNETGSKIAKPKNYSKTSYGFGGEPFFAFDCEI